MLNYGKNDTIRSLFTNEACCRPGKTLEVTCILRRGKLRPGKNFGKEPATEPLSTLGLLCGSGAQLTLKRSRIFHLVNILCAPHHVYLSIHTRSRA